MSRNGHGNALLMEITIVLFFFALSATVMLGMFLSAHDLSVSGRSMNRALFIAQDCVESLYASSDPDAHLAATGFERDGERYRFVQDQGVEVSVTLSSDQRDAGLLWEATVAVNDKDGGVITELPATWYVADAVKEAA